eukprot:m.290315 g.290315  ORF g.290315 m.290315 type:complete len:173 (+) comp55073_c0_seq3:151-669(+)
MLHLSTATLREQPSKQPTFSLRTYHTKKNTHTPCSRIYSESSNQKINNQIAIRKQAPVIFASHHRPPRGNSLQGAKAHIDSSGRKGASSLSHKGSCGFQEGAQRLVAGVALKSSARLLKPFHRTSSATKSAANPLTRRPDASASAGERRQSFFRKGSDFGMSRQSLAISSAG